jgi:hypothetical protein
LPLRLISVLPLLVACFVLTPVRGAGDQKNDNPPAEVVAPKEGAVVAEVEEFEGRLAVSGWPVVFVRPLIEGEPWWVQPAVEEVVNGQFTGRAHFGDKNTPKETKFALVVLVARNKKEADRFMAGKTLSTLPTDLPHSREVTVFRDARGPLQFAGRSWRVKGGRRLGPGPNDFSDAVDNVWLDDKDHLHLAITKADNRWQCAEVVAEESLGYGEYRWVVAGDLAALDRQVVLGLFTYETTSREIDFELSRWGNKAKANAQFVVQPYTAKDSTYRFDTAQAKLLTISLVWEKDLVQGRCWDGEDTTKEPLADWKYTGRNNPPPGKERARANLWLFEGKAPSPGTKQEVVIHSFEFKPADTPKRPDR